MLDFQQTADALVLIARPILLQNFEELKENPGAIESKREGRELVSKGERLAEQAMVKHIKTHFPEHGIIGEETGNHNLEAEYCWVFDPIDGTQAMLDVAKGKQGGFGLTIGLLYNDIPTLGYVHDLPNDKTYKGTDIAMQQSQAPFKIASTVPDIMFKTQVQQSTFKNIASQHKVVKNRNCLGFMDLIDGKVDAVWEGDLAFHDIVPLIAPLEQASIVITDESGAALSFSRDKIADEYRVFAALPQVHAELLPEIKKAVSDEKPIPNNADSGIWGSKFGSKFPGPF